MGKLFVWFSLGIHLTLTIRNTLFHISNSGISVEQLNEYLIQIKKNIYI